MKIAVASQNRRQVTGHVGRCTHFWIYEVADGKVTDKQLLEFPEEQSFHNSSPHGSHPLDGVQVLIGGGMGQGVVQRLKRKNIEVVLTEETDLDKAVSAYLEGNISPLSLPQHQETCSHGHQHSHGADGECRH